MMNRNSVAKEKLAQAAVLMNENGVDLWVVYARQAGDPALALLFNTDVQNEVLFCLWQDGRVVALADPADVAELEQSGLYTQVIPATTATMMPLFLAESGRLPVAKLALNTSEDDARCDGLALGLYRKLEEAMGREVLGGVEVCSENMLETLRAVKTTSEIAIMEECSKITTDIYDVVFEQLRVGMSETDVGDLMLAELAKRNSGTGIGDPTEYPLICIIRCGLAHRKPSPKNIIMAGDMMVIDFSARFNGYTSDIARTMYFMKPGETEMPQAAKHCIESAIYAVGKVLEMIKPGMRGFEVDHIGRCAIVERGYPPFPHSTGHQVGLECHDGGTILGPNQAKKAMCGVLRVNEIYAIEPTVLQAGGLPCAIVEDNILLTPDGCRLISKRQTAAIAIPYREG